MIAADPLYDDAHPELVANMFQRYLKYDRTTRALIAVPLRDKATKVLVRKFIEFMTFHNFQLIYEGEELFWDEDWVDANEEGVRCWWGIWSWNIPWVL